MAESARGSKSSDEDITSVMPIEIFMSLSSTSEVSSITFNNVSECYPPDRDLECRYTIKSSVKPSSRDWIGLFKVGWQSSRDYCTYEWSPMPSILDGEQGTPVANRVVFRLRYLPKNDDEFYQFCYVTYAGCVKGFSAPFQIKTRPIEQEELECCEIEDDELGTSIMVVKNKTAMLEESLARVLEENAALKASNETALADLASANDKVMESECRKAELTAALQENEKKASNLEQVLAQKDQALEEEQRKRGELESTNSDLKTTLENLNKRVDKMMKLEQERVQTSQQNEKNMKKFETERKQYLENMATDQQMIEKLQNEIDAKEDEINALKARLVEFETKVRSESTKLCKKVEKANGENVRLREQLVQITEDNSLLRKNLEEESERLTKEVQDRYFEMKKKEQELEQVSKENASYRHRIEEVDSSMAEILKKASHDEELLGQKIEKLQRDLNKKQELIHQLEQELEDANTQLEQETGKIAALEEDYEQKVRALQNQLEEEKALNQSLCSQADRNLASLQDQVQKQQETNVELSQQLEGINAEFKDVCDELDNCKKQLQSAEEKLQISMAQLTAVDTEVKSIKLEKETLQTALKASAQSAASMYALQTAYTHIKKQYLKVRKEMTGLWRERIKLKKTIDAPFNGNSPCDDLHLQLEEVRACNEDLRIRLNMGAEAFKKKYIKCRQLEEQLNKVTRTLSQSEEAGSALQMRKKVSKLRKALEEEKKTLNIKKSLLSQKSDETYQNTEGSKSADQHGNASLRNQAADANRLQLLQPSQVLQEHENFPHEMLDFQKSWQSRNRRPVRHCTQESTNPRLVI